MQDGLREKMPVWLAPLAFGLVLLSFLCGSPWPLTHVIGRLDQAVYVLGGAEWVQGHIPYRDFWDNKPPSIYLLNAIAWKLSGGCLGIWVISLACATGGVLLFFDICRRLYGAAALPVTALYLAETAPHAGPDVVNDFILFLTLAALRIFLGRAARPGGLWPAGFLLGLIWAIALLFRPNACLALTGVLALLTVLAWRRRGPLAGAGVMLAQGSGAATYLVPVAWYFWRQHAMRAMLDCLVSFNAAYVSGRFPEHVQAALYGLTVAAGGDVPLLAGAVIWVTLRPFRHAAFELRLMERALPALLLAELAFASAAGQNFGDYFSLALLIGALLIGSMLASILSLAGGHGLPPEFTKAIRAAWYGGLIIPAFIGFAAASEPLLTKGFWFNHPVSDVAGFIRAHPGNGQVFVWGNRPGIYLLPGVQADVRFSFILPFMIPRYANGGRVGDLLAALDRTRPDYIFDLNAADGVPPLSGAGGEMDLSAPCLAQGWRNSPALRPVYAYVARHYRILPNALAGVTVYQRIAG